MDSVLHFGTSELSSRLPVDVEHQVWSYLDLEELGRLSHTSHRVCHAVVVFLTRAKSLYLRLASQYGARGLGLLAGLASGRLKQLELHGPRSLAPLVQRFALQIVATNRLTIERCVGQAILGQCDELKLSLAECPKLRELSLNHSDGTDIAKRVVATGCRLSHIRLVEAAVPDDVLISILRVSRLEELTLASIGPTVIASLADVNLKRLRYLSIWMPIDDRGQCETVRRAVSSLPALERLEITPGKADPNAVWHLPHVRQIYGGADFPFYAPRLRNFVGKQNAANFAATTKASPEVRLYYRDYFALHDNAVDLAGIAAITRNLASGVWPRLQALHSCDPVDLSILRPAFALWKLRDCVLKLAPVCPPLNIVPLIVRHSPLLRTLSLRFLEGREPEQLEDAIGRPGPRTVASELQELVLDIGDDSLFRNAFFPHLATVHLRGPVAKFETFGMPLQSPIMPQLVELTYEVRMGAPVNRDCFDAFLNLHPGAVGVLRDRMD